MNRCNEHKDKQLRDYFLNRLSPEETETFQFHLLHCETCRIQLERMRRLATGWEEGETASEPDTEQFQAGRKRRFSLNLFSRVAVAAGILLLLAGGGYYWMHIPSEEGYPIEINEPPVFHSADSVAIEADSTIVDIKEKKKRDAE